jgi:hypothetical protein
MFTDEVERMKRQYTDKYVVVDATRPELARFRDVVGRVKTVNMNGQALVEFDDYHLNIAWYDIAPEFLKVVDKPPPKLHKPEAKKPADKAAAKPAAPKAAAKAPPAGAKPGKGSVADILAAARAGKAPPAAKPKAEAAPTAEMPVSDAPAKTQASPKVERSKMSVADMIAAARAGGAGAQTQAEKKPVEELPSDETVAEAPAPAAQPPGKPAGEPASAGGVTRVDKSGMSIDDILAYCRQHDAK